MGGDEWEWIPQFPSLVFVRVPTHGLLAIRSLQRRVVRILGHPQHGVVICAHSLYLCDASSVVVVGRRRRWARCGSLRSLLLPFGNDDRSRKKRRLREDCAKIARFFFFLSLRPRLLVALQAERRLLRLLLLARDLVVLFTRRGSVRVCAQSTVCVLLVLRSRGGRLPNKIITPSEVFQKRRIDARPIFFQRIILVTSVFLSWQHKSNMFG